MKNESVLSAANAMIDDVTTALDAIDGIAAAIALLHSGEEEATVSDKVVRRAALGIELLVEKAQDRIKRFDDCEARLTLVESSYYAKKSA